MNYKEINDMINMLLGDTSTTFFTPQDRAMSINQGCRMIAAECDFLRNTQTFNTVVDVGGYILPSSFRNLGDGIDLLEDEGAQALHWKSIQQLRTENPNWERTAGRPTHYTIENSNIYFYPQPDAEYTIRMNYQPAPNLLTQDDDIPFFGNLRAEPYHDCIAFYAGYLLALKDREFDLAQQMLGMYTARMIDFKEALRQTGDVIKPVLWDDPYRGNQ